MERSTRAWRKSSHSLNEDACCVEVADFPGEPAVRDSKDPDGPVLRFTPQAWTAFVSEVRSGACGGLPGRSL